MMFGLFRKKKSVDECMVEAHVETHAIFTELTILETLAYMHRLVLEGQASPEECNDLLLGAYRTLYLAAGVGRWRLLRKTKDEIAADKVANTIMTDSGIFNIVQMIRSSIPGTGMEQTPIIFKEMGIIFHVARVFEEMVTQGQHEKAFEIWRTCAKGAYSELKKMGIS
ncbi:hypothetical protein [Azonexus hydrophilus]|uniref:hypothetical protein n=1 Tax=Azonexus hydrophilus TaxID=418702 RepID=UPI00048A7083|nr:hypothetical protein [Azonexus hydrophilus]